MLKDPLHCRGVASTMSKDLIRQHIAISVQMYLIPLKYKHVQYIHLIRHGENNCRTVSMEHGLSNQSKHIANIYQANRKHTPTYIEVYPIYVRNTQDTQNTVGGTNCAREN